MEMLTCRKCGRCGGDACSALKMRFSTYPTLRTCYRALSFPWLVVVYLVTLASYAHHQHLCICCCCLQVVSSVKAFKEACAVEMPRLFGRGKNYDVVGLGDWLDIDK